MTKDAWLLSVELHSPTGQRDCPISMAMLLTCCLIGSVFLGKESHRFSEHLWWRYTWGMLDRTECE